MPFASPCRCALYSGALLFPLLLAAPARGDDLILGMSAPFTGPSRALGIELYRGARAYFDEVNRAGGVHGRKIVLRAYDDGYDPVRTVHNTVRLVETDRVFALFGYVGTPTVTRMLPLLRRYADRNVLLLFPFTGAEPQRRAPYDDLVFNLRASYRQETSALVDHFVAAGRRRVAVMYQIDAYGRTGWEGVRLALKRHGLRLTGEATYRRGAALADSMRPQVMRLRKGAPDAVICVGSYAPCAAFIRDARDAGWDVPIANLSFAGSESLLRALHEEGARAGKDYTHALVASQVVPCYYGLELPAVREYRALMERHRPAPPPDLAGEDYIPLPYSYVGFEGFLDAKLLVVALRKLGPDPRPALLRRTLEALAAVDLGIDVPVSFGPARHQGLDRVYLAAVREGRFVPLTTWRAGK